jgi:NB-ARC domain
LLSGERPQLETLNAAAAKLGETLGDRRILMVVDDVWRKPDLEPFLRSGRHCLRLVTTRIDSVLPEKAVAQKVDAMRGDEALSLLSGGLPRDQTTRERASLKSLAARFGEWPLLLKTVNGFLRNRVNGGEPLPIAIAAANKRLDAKGLTVFDAGDKTQRANAVAFTIGVSLDLLSAPERERFGELGVFPEDADIPVGVVARLWAETGGLADFETEDLLGKLFDLSLLLERDLGQGFFRLHDTVRQFLRARTGEERLVTQHRVLVASLDGAGKAADERTRRYFYLSRPHHLAEAGERDQLDALLLDPAWLKAKLDATANRTVPRLSAICRQRSAEPHRPNLEADCRYLRPRPVSIATPVDRAFDGLRSGALVSLCGKSPRPCFRAGPCSASSWPLPAWRGNRSSRRT